MAGVFVGGKVGGEEGWEGGRGDPGGEVGEMGVESGSQAEDGSLWLLDGWSEREEIYVAYLRIRRARHLLLSRHLALRWRVELHPVGY